MPAISCVIPTYNRCPYPDKKHNPLYWCLTSLNAQKRAGLEEIIIIDDASQDFTPQIVEEIKKERGIEIVYERNKERKGSGQSRNLGVKLVKNDLTFFLDDDCIVLGQETLFGLKYAFSHAEKLVKAGAMSLPVTPGSLEAIIEETSKIGQIDYKEGRMLGCSTKFPREYLTNLPAFYLDQEKKIVRPLEVRTMCGVFLCTKKAFEEAGGFPSFPWRNAYAEEPDLALRMQERGYKVFFLPSLDEKFWVFHCKFGYQSFNRQNISKLYPLMVDGILFKEIVEESREERENTGNRVNKEEVLYSVIISDLWIMFRYIGIEVGINSILSKHKKIESGNYLDLIDIPPEKRYEIWHRAVEDGLRFLGERKILSGPEKDTVLSRIFLYSGYTPLKE